jgi:hypothetical protein
VYVSFAVEPDHAATLELCAAAGPLFAHLPREPLSTAALRVR